MDEALAATLLPRALGDRNPEQGEAAFSHLAFDNPWPVDESVYLERLPDDWI